MTDKLIKRLTDGEICNLCDGGWHELSKVRLEGDQLHASILCVESGTSELVHLPVDEI